MKFIKMFFNFLLSPFTQGKTRNTDDPIATQVRLAIAIPLQELSVAQIDALGQGEVLIIPIRNSAIKNIMAIGTAEHFHYIHSIVDELSRSLRYEIHLFPEIRGNETEYSMAVNLYPDDLSVPLPDEPDDEQPVAEPVAEAIEAPMKAMAAGAGRR